MSDPISRISKQSVIELQATPYSFGYSFSAPANTTTNIDIPVPDNFILMAGEYCVSPSLMSDFFDAFLYDKNDVLGYGPLVLGQFAATKKVRSGWVHRLELDTATVFNVNGLYFRIAYTSTDPVLAATGWINFEGYDTTPPQA